MKPQANDCSTRTRQDKESVKTIFKKCHKCGKVIESNSEVKRCPACNKNFLPVKYFQRSQYVFNEDFESLYSSSDELSEENLIIGLYVIW